MRYKRLIIFLIVFAAVATFFIYTKTQAQNPIQGISVHPDYFNITSNGKPQQEEISVDNSTGQDIKIAVLIKNFTAQGEEGGINITSENTGFSLASWMSVTPQTAVIKKGGTQQFLVTITPPQNAEPGGHFGSIVFSTIANANTNGLGAAVSQQIASIILFTVPGDAEERAVVESLTTDKNFYEFGPVNFSLRVHNLGRVHIQPFGSIIVSNIFGNKYYLPIESRTVLPNSIRRIPVSLPTRLLIGPYTAYIVASFGTKGQPLYGETTFYAFPLRYGAVGLVILILLFLLRKRLFRAFRIIITGSDGANKKEKNKENAEINNHV